MNKHLVMCKDAQGTFTMASAPSKEAAEEKIKSFENGLYPDYKGKMFIINVNK